MKAKTITSLIIGITLSALAPTTWAGGRGGGGGGGFHGGGFGGGGFHGGGGRAFGGGFRGGFGGFYGGRAFGGGARFAAPGRSFGGPRAFAAQNRGAPGFRAAGMTGRTGTGTNTSRMSRTASQRTGIASTARPATRSTTPRVASSQNTRVFAARSQAGAGQNGLNGRTDHIAERHSANWNRDWDHHHSHFRNGRFFVFDNGFWWGLDEGYYPWDYYPYSDYDYYPYDYYVGDPDNVPADYQGTATSAPAPDATVENVQTQLTQQGYYGGPIDGLFGPTTRDALARYQTGKDLNVTGSLSPDTLESFGLPPQVATN